VPYEVTEAGWTDDDLATLADGPDDAVQAGAEPDDTPEPDDAELIDEDVVESDPDLDTRP
jgi:hypothetical protein